MEKISTDDLYIGALVNEQNNIIREILYKQEDKKAKDVFYDTEEYVINDLGIIEPNNGFRIVNSAKLKPFLQILKFKEEIGLIDLYRIYSLFMKDNMFLENCAFLFGLEVDEEGNIHINERCQQNGEGLITEYENLYNNSFLENRASKEEKELHKIKIRKLLK